MQKTKKHKETYKRSKTQREYTEIHTIQRIKEHDNKKTTTLLQPYPIPHARLRTIREGRLTNCKTDARDEERDAESTAATRRKKDAGARSDEREKEEVADEEQNTRAR